MVPLALLLTLSAVQAPFNTPQEVWRDFDPRRDPLEVELKRTWVDAGVQYREFYFTGETIDGQPVRVYAQYAAPEGGRALPAVLHIHGGGQTVNPSWLAFWTKRGYAAMTFNWGGRWDDIEGKARPLVVFEANQLDQQPLLADLAKLDFHFKPGSPTPAGWQPLLIEQMGLQKTPERASWPVRHEVEGEPAGATVNQRLALRWPKPVAVPADGVTLSLKDTPERAAISGPPCSARLAYADGKLTVTVTVPLRDPAKLVRSDTWGASDGVEVCFRDASDAAKPGTIWVLQGHATGTHRGSGDGGAPADAVAKLDAASSYRAEVAADHWTATWTIPLASAGLHPAAGLKLGFNIGVRRGETDEWIAWAGAMGPNWQLDGTGLLTLVARPSRP